MQVKYKQALIIAGIIINILTSCTNSSNGEKEPYSSVDKCKEIKIGMTYSLVTEKMGNPINIVEINKKGRIKERLYFSSPRLSSTFIQCLIDKQSGLVEEVICSEDYKLNIK